MERSFPRTCSYHHICVLCQAGHPTKGCPLTPIDSALKPLSKQGSRTIPRHCMHDCIGLCLSYLLLFLQRTHAHCLLIMTALICFFNACMSTCDTTYVLTRCVHVDCRLYGTAIRQGSALCCCCLPCTCTLNAGYNGTCQQSGSCIVASVLARPSWSGAHHLVCLVHHSLRSTGLNSNDDIHSTTRLIST